VVWYGLGRAWIEGLRTDSLYWGTVRVSQILAVVTCVAGAVVLSILAFRQHSPDKLYVNQVAAKAAEAEATAEAEVNEEAETE
jgi:phosphatidylglycerol:prolipoprotein diacylglycerol transferase